jgi:hypothetical protein
MTVPPLSIRVNPEDNVAIVVNECGLPAGSRSERRRIADCDGGANRRKPLAYKNRHAPN